MRLIVLDSQLKVMPKLLLSQQTDLQPLVDNCGLHFCSLSLTPPPRKYAPRPSGRHVLMSLIQYRLGDAPQMLNQDPKRHGAQEEDRRAEARLLGSGSRIKYVSQRDFFSVIHLFWNYYIGDIALIKLHYP